MIVMKFGGTSTRDARSIKNVVKIIQSHLQGSPIVVVSAIAQATNILEKAGESAADGREREAVEGIRTLIERHLSITDSLIPAGDRRKNVTEFIQSAHMDLKTLVQGISILKELTPRTLDSLYCYGELLSSRIITAVLQDNEVDAVWLDTKDFMITDGGHTQAQPLFELIEKNLKQIVTPLLKRKAVPVTQGFIGVTQGRPWVGKVPITPHRSSDRSSKLMIFRYGPM
jgi:aspartate kinase